MTDTSGGEGTVKLIDVLLFFAENWKFVVLFPLAVALATAIYLYFTANNDEISYIVPASYSSKVMVQADEQAINLLDEYSTINKIAQAAGLSTANLTLNEAETLRWQIDFDREELKDRWTITYWNRESELQAEEVMRVIVSVLQEATVQGAASNSDVYLAGQQQLSSLIEEIEGRIASLGHAATGLSGSAEQDVELARSRMELVLFELNERLDAVEKELEALQEETPRIVADIEVSTSAEAVQTRPEQSAGHYCNAPRRGIRPGICRGGSAFRNPFIPAAPGFNGQNRAFA